MPAFSSPHATILLLISDPLMREVLRDALQSAGYLVMTAGDIGAGVDRVTEMRPDLLITRSYINSMPGRMAADYLRTKRPGLPVLIVSGFMDDDRVRAQHSISDFHIFPSPFTRTEFLDQVKDVLSTILK